MALWEFNELFKVGHVQTHQNKFPSRIRRDWNQQVNTQVCSLSSYTAWSRRSCSHAMMADHQHILLVLTEA
jgi:hypothetical protein